MDIVTLPVGLVIGLFPVIVDMGGQGGNARLLLDARPVCEVRAAAPSCMVDLGPLPRIHTLDLERLDERGQVVEHVRRYLNRGFSGDVRAVGGCDETREACEFELAWSHPARSEPLSVTATVDGRGVPLQRSHLRFPSPRSSPAQVLTLEAKFADGGRAQFTRLLHGSYSEEAEARLQHVELETDVPRSGGEVESALRSAGWKLRTVEQGEVEVLFVLEPRAFRSLEKMSANAGSGGPAKDRDLEGVGVGPIRFLVAGESLAVRESPARRGENVSWRRAIFDLASRSGASRVRVADAVAAGGFHLGAGARRRALVLVLADAATEARNPDASFFSREGALAYLRDAHVPIVVWQTGPPDTRWPAAERISSIQDLDNAVANLRAKIDRQWLAWVEGDAGSDPPVMTLGDGLKIAGPDVPPAVSATRTDVLPLLAGPPPAPAADVYALASDGHGALFAATANGLFFTADAGLTWTKAALPDSSPAFSVALGSGDGEVLAGTGRALVRGRFGSDAWSFAPLPTVQALAVAPSGGGAGTVYASARGNLFRSVDGGRHWTNGGTGVDAAYAVSLAVDPRNAEVAYAGTMGSGVFESRNRGASWDLTGRALQDAGVRCLLVDPHPQVSGRVFAGTEGGLFVRTSRRTDWTRVPGFPHTIVYSLSAGGGDSDTLFAGTETGLYESHDRGASWTRNAAVAPTTVVTTLAVSGGVLFAGTLTSGVVRVPFARPAEVR